MSDGYQRIEVITGAAHRRRWTTEEKLRIVDETLRCGESISVIARRHGVALARAFRSRKLLDTGVHTTLEDLARAKGVAPSYVSRILRLTLLAPDIVGRSSTGGSRRSCSCDLLRSFPLEWEGQRCATVTLRA